MVIASIGGDPAQHTFLDLARAFACAGRVVHQLQLGFVRR